MTDSDFPHIWTRRPKIIMPRRDPIAAVGPRLQGWFRIEAGKRDGRRRVLADWFPNLITNAGLDWLGDFSAAQTGSFNEIFDECRVGSGTSAPSVNDTALDTQVAVHNSFWSEKIVGVNEEPEGTWYGFSRMRWRFGEGDAAGNLAEVGIGPPDAANLFSRSRILDGEGNPTTITVLADEFLDVWYEIRVYPPPTDAEGTVELGASSDLVFDYRVMPMAINAAIDWSLSDDTASGINRGDSLSCARRPNDNVHTVNDDPLPIDRLTSPPGGGSACSSSLIADYTNGNHYTDNSFTWGLARGNFAGGIQMAEFMMGMTNRSGSDGKLGAWGVGFTPAIPKDETQILELQFRFSWARKAL